MKLQAPDYWVTVHALKSLSDGGILDPDDLLTDVADDREQVGTANSFISLSLINCCDAYALELVQECVEYSNKYRRFFIIVYCISSLCIFVV